MFSTLPIVTDQGRGTGFIFLHENEDGVLPILITNKHVLEGASQVTLRFHLGENGKPSGRTQSITLDHIPPVLHPASNVDLCALSLSPYFLMLDDQGLSPYFVGIGQAEMPSPDQMAELSGLENVIMVGYPNGLSDQVNNFPIMRRGITASHPGVNFNGMAEGVVDMACFPGSSGSPIFVFDQGAYQDRQGLTRIGGGRFFFLGVLYGGPVMKADGQIEVRTIPTAQVPVAVTQMMIHLGYYIKAQEVQVLVEHVLAVAARHSPPPRP